MSFDYETAVSIVSKRFATLASRMVYNWVATVRGAVVHRSCVVCQNSQRFARRICRRSQVSGERDLLSIRYPQGSHRGLGSRFASTCTVVLGMTQILAANIQTLQNRSHAKVCENDPDGFEPEASVQDALVTNLHQESSQALL